MSTTLHTIFLFSVDIFIFYCAFRINRTRKIMKRKNEIFSKMIHYFPNGIEKEIDKKIADIHSRLNVLSKENIRLNEEKEILMDKLRNLGVNDFDINN